MNLHRKGDEIRLFSLCRLPPENVPPRNLERKIRDAVDQWRDVLGRQVPHARQIVTKLLVEKLSFEPMDRNGQPGFRFQATGTVEKLISGVVPGFPQAVVSPRGLVLLYQIEIRGDTRRAA